MAADLDLYYNREQSFIKHLFLTKYLQTAAYKILQGRSQTFNFVDAFAGPWKISDDAQYSDASFDQAISTLEAVRADLDERGKGGLRIRFCFCERCPNAVARLREYAAEKKPFEIYIFEGEFEANLDGIAAKLPDGFTFTFIDPTGWKIDTEKVLLFLREQKGEFMFNFMSDHINRFAGYEKVESSFDWLLAGPKWEDKFNRLPACWNNEQKVLHLIKEKMRTSKVATYVPDFPIMVPRIERVKMRLLLGTHSPEGLEVFRHVQEKVEKKEMEIRDGLSEGDSPQLRLFTPEHMAGLNQEQGGVGCKINQNLAEDIIVDFLKKHGHASVGDMCNLAKEKVHIRQKQLNTLLKNMRARRVIHFDLPKGKRVPQPGSILTLASALTARH